MAEQPPITGQPPAIVALQATYLSSLTEEYTRNALRGRNFVHLLPAFNWVVPDPFRFRRLDRVVVPNALDQGRHDESCIAYGIKTLLQFQMNLIGSLANQPEVPQLSLNHLKAVLDSVEDKTVSGVLSWIQNHGIVAERDFDTRYSKPREMVDEFDWSGRTVYNGEGTLTVAGKKENGEDKEAGHLVALLGWRWNVYYYLNSHGRSFGMQIGGIRGFGRTRKGGIHHIYVPQIRRWFQ